MGFLKNLFGTPQQQPVLSQGTLAFLRDLAYIMGYSLSDNATSFPQDVWAARASIMTILQLPTLPNSAKQAMIFERIWEISKHPDLNYQLIDSILAMGGIRSQAEGRAETDQFLERLKNRSK